MEKDKFLIQLGLRIRHIRKQKGMTQQHLSNVSDIEKANLSRIESGITNPTVLTLLKISNAFDVTVIDLFDHSQNGNGTL